MRLAGVLDTAAASDVEEVLLADRCGRVVILDVSGLRFCAAAGIRALLAVAGRYRARGGHLIMAMAVDAESLVLTADGISVFRSPADSVLDCQGRVPEADRDAAADSAAWSVRLG